MLTERPRRNRKSGAIRDMIAETQLSSNDFIAPLFLIDADKQEIAIESMPGHARLGRENLLKKCEELLEAGVRSVCLFPALEEKFKDKEATLSKDPNHFYQQAIKDLKEKFPELALMSDVAMDPYSIDGHDGYVNEKGEIENDRTLKILCEMALTQAQSGIDIIGPSDMMDGRVGAIREALDDNGFTNVSIMSYTTKYASAFYGPFREALESEPRGGDKKTYQMDFRNKREALREAQFDEEEGADFLMVKPGLAYLDIISELKQSSPLPIAAYNVSGEYAMVKAAAERGWIDGTAVMLETLYAFKRAGADIILTYFALEAAKELK